MDALSYQSVVVLCCPHTHVQAHTRQCPTWKPHLPATVSVLPAFLCKGIVIKDDEGHAVKQPHFRCCCFTFAIPPQVIVQELADDLKAWPVVTFAVGCRGTRSIALVHGVQFNISTTYVDETLSTGVVYEKDWYCNAYLDKVTGDGPKQHPRRKTKARSKS